MAMVMTNYLWCAIIILDDALYADAAARVALPRVISALTSHPRAYSLLPGCRMCRPWPDGTVIFLSAHRPKASPAAASNHVSARRPGAERAARLC
jgi:hypothetical protein